MFIFFFAGIFEDEFIEERRQGLEGFINRFVKMITVTIKIVLFCYLVLLEKGR